MKINRDLLIRSYEKLDDWIERNDYKGYEYYDGLTSWLRLLTCGNWFAERLLAQSFKRFPFNVRHFFGVTPLHSTKGMAYFARGYLRLWKATGNEAYMEKAEFCFDWLIENQSEGYSGACWGNHFDHSSGAFRLPKFAPTVVWSGLIGQAFLHGYEILGDKKYLDIARSVCDFIIKDLPKTEYQDSFCISYVTFAKLLIHNANMIGASLLARSYYYTKEPMLFELSGKAMKYSCDAQLDNGAWYYAESDNGRWIDNWHTAYNLDALKCYIDSTGDNTFEENLSIGYKFFRDNFFCSDGRPKYYHNRLRWVDIQAASQAIDTFCYFSEYDVVALAMAQKIAVWTINNMQDRTGFFYYRDIGWKKVKIPMVHWGQATMLSALGHLMFKLKDD